MLISVKVHPKSKQRKIQQVMPAELSSNKYSFEIWTRELPEKNKANEDILEQIAYYLNLPKSKLKIISGQASKNKLIELVD